MSEPTVADIIARTYRTTGCRSDAVNICNEQFPDISKAEWATMWDAIAAYVDEDKEHASTIRIGEYDVPEPLRVMPLYGDWVYLANPFHVKCVQASYFDRDFSAHKLWFEGGLLHATPEAAMLHSKALVSLTARSDV